MKSHAMKMTKYLQLIASIARGVICTSITTNAVLLANPIAMPVARISIG